jgi:O-antigen/teichoic acid export membrane protein
MLLDPVTRGWVVVTGSGLLRLLLGLVASLVIARGLGPAVYGVYAVLAATVAITSTLAEGGLTEAAVLRMAKLWPAQATQVRQRGAAFFWLRLGLAAVVIGLACGLAPLLAHALLNLNGADDAAWVRWALLGVVATAASGAVGAMLQATGRFGRMSSLTLLNTALTAVLAIGLAATGSLTLLSALVVLGIGTSLVTFAVGARLLPHGWSLAPPALRALRAEAGQLVRTGRWLWLASLCAMLAANLDIVLLNRFSAAATVGAYALAVSLASKADLVNQSLYTVLLPGVAVLGSRAQVLAYLRRGLLRSGLICLGLLALLPLAEPLVVLIYGPAFAPAAGLLRWLLLVVIFDVLATPIVLLPLAYGQARVLAAADGARGITLGLVALLLLPIFGPTGAVVARFAARLVGASVAVAAVWRGRSGWRSTAQ